MTNPAGEPVPQRIGDTERDRAVEALREHLAQGRLDETEFDERLTAALSAKTTGDLDPLFADLPGPRPGQGLAASNAYTAPLSSSQTGLNPTESSQAMAPADKKWNTALVVAASIAWPLTLLVLFATSWDYWWLVFIPIMISSIAGRSRHGSHRDRNRDHRRGIES